MGHLKDVTDNKMSNSMTKHMRNYHDNITQPIKSRVVAKHNSCLERFVDESLRIEEGELQVGLANSKLEWGQGSKLVRLRAENQTTQRPGMSRNQIPDRGKDGFNQ